MNAHRGISRSGSPVAGNAVITKEPARLPRPNEAARTAPATELRFRCSPDATDRTDIAPRGIAVSRVAYVRRRRGPVVAIIRSARATGIAASRPPLERVFGGSVSTASAATAADAARVDIDT